MSHFKTILKEKIDKTLGIEVNIEVSDKLIFELNTALEVDFLFNYFKNNVFGKKYRDLDNNTRIFKKSDKKITVTNTTACLILLNHFNIKISNIEDLDTMFDTGKMIYILSKNKDRIPVLILSDISNKNIFKILANYYKNAWNLEEGIIKHILSISKNIYEDGLKGIAETLTTQTQHLDNIYIVYHPFSERNNTSSIGDSYKKIFTKVGDNDYGNKVMKYMNAPIPTIDDTDRLELKENLDKMFASQTVLTPIELNISPKSIPIRKAPIPRKATPIKTSPIYENLKQPPAPTRPTQSPTRPAPTRPAPAAPTRPHSPAAPTPAAPTPPTPTRPPKSPAAPTRPHSPTRPPTRPHSPARPPTRPHSPARPAPPATDRKAAAEKAETDRKAAAEKAEAARKEARKVEKAARKAEEAARKEEKAKAVAAKKEEKAARKEARKVEKAARKAEEATRKVEEAKAEAEARKEEESKKEAANNQNESDNENMIFKNPVYVKTVEE